MAKINSLTHEDKAAQKEYMRMRAAFMKRAKRAQAAGMKEASIYLKGGYAYLPSITEIKKLPYLTGANADVYKRDLSRRLEITERLLSTGTASLKAYRARQRERDAAIINTLHDNGYEHISKSNLKKFGQFMDAMREQYGKRLPNSEQMAEFFDSLKYNTKRKSLDYILDLWGEFESNGYEPDPDNYDLFRS